MPMSLSEALMSNELYGYFLGDVDHQPGTYDVGFTIPDTGGTEITIKVRANLGNTNGPASLSGTDHKRMKRLTKRLPGG